MVGFIYIIKNNINNKVYIGQTRVSVEQRWKEHLRHSRYGNQIINKAMKKYGIENFYIEVLETCNLEDLDTKEMFYIKLYNSTNKNKGYNISIGGSTPKFKREVLPIETIIDLYTNKKRTLDEIAKKFKVTRYIIRTELYNSGISIRNKHSQNTKFDNINKEKIQEVLNLGLSLRKSAKLLKIPYSTFRKACIFHNIEYNSSKSARH